MNNVQNLKFHNKNSEEQIAHILALREKRRLLKAKKGRSKPPKVPKWEFASQEHKMTWLALPKIYQKLF